MIKAKAVLFDPARTFADNFDNGPFPSESERKPFVNTGVPSYKFLGKTLYSPFGIPAGPLPTSQHTTYAFERGFDVVCYKTQRSVEFACNEFTNVLYLDIQGDLTLEKAAQPQVGRTETESEASDISITNSFGNPSKGPEFWIDDLKKAHQAQGKGQLLIMSVVGTIKDGFSSEDYYNDFAYTASLAAKTGVEAIELNLSCPNVATEGVLCYSKDAVLSICKKTKEKVGNIPLVAKFGYFSEEQQPLLEDIIKSISPYISAISSINTISAPIVDEKGDQALPGPNRLNSGVCGKGVKWAGIDMVKRLDKLRKAKNLEYEIIGVGGVMTAADFQEYRKAGADVVQSATGAMWNPHLAAEVKQTL